MRAIFEGQSGRLITGRLEKGDKLPDALLDVCKQRGVKAGWIFAIGAASKLSVSAYAQREKKYLKPVHVEGDWEILSLCGNASTLEGEVFLHLHVVASSMEDGKVEMLAGHLLDAEVFALEFFIVPVEGVVLERVFESATGLKLWHG